MRPDPLQPVGDVFRAASILFLVPACFLSAAASVFAIMHMVQRQSLLYKGKPLWIGVLVVMVLSVVSGWLAVRLWRSTLSRNGVTVLPTWSIEVFGVFFGVGIVCVTIATQDVSHLLNVAGVVIAMVGIRRFIRAKKQRAG